MSGRDANCGRSIPGHILSFQRRSSYSGTRTCRVDLNDLLTTTNPVVFNPTERARNMNVGVLASHEGTTLQSLLDAFSSGRIQGRVAVVVSARRSLTG